MRILPIILTFLVMTFLVMLPSFPNWTLLLFGCALWIAFVGVVAYQSRDRD